MSWSWHLLKNSTMLPSVNLMLPLLVLLPPIAAAAIAMASNVEQ